MEWVIRFIAVWIIFIILVDWKQLKTNIWCGLFSIALQFLIDSFSLNNRLYEVHNPVISIWGSSFFFTFGPVVVIGVLIAQYQPRKRWARIVNVIAFTVIYSLEELLLVQRNAITYVNWNFRASLGINVLIMIALSWFSLVILKRGMNEN